MKFIDLISPQTAILLLRIDDIVSGTKKAGDRAEAPAAAAPQGGQPPMDG